MNGQAVNPASFTLKQNKTFKAKKSYRRKYFVSLCINIALISAILYLTLK